MQKKPGKGSLFIATLCVVAGICFIYIKDNCSFNPRTEVVVKGKKFNAEIMNTAKCRAKGMMFRKEMEDDAAMLFDFGTAQMANFWMKNTYLPLDIIFISEDKKAVNMKNYATPLSEELIPSVFPIRYALEVKAGTVKQLTIKTGDNIDIK